MSSFPIHMHVMAVCFCDAHDGDDGDDGGECDDVAGDEVVDGADGDAEICS